MSDNTKMREAVLKILASYKQEMERYGYYSSNPGVSVDDFEEIADEIVAWQAARTVPEGSMVVSAKWLERHAGPEDHACVRCYPHSDMLVDGFLCYYHKALDVIAAAPEVNK